MATTTEAIPSTLFRRATVSEIALLFLAAAITPFVIHRIPSWDQAPLGAHLLPMFWAAFVAAYLFGVRLGVITALVSPLLNFLMTGLPAAKHIGVLSCELVVFCCVAVWLVKRLPRFWAIAPLAYVAAKIVSTGLQAATGVFGDIGAPLSFLRQSLVNAFAGLLVLALINAGLVRISRNAGREA